MILLLSALRHNCATMESGLAFSFLFFAIPFILEQI
jgi:hypothetical protein